MEYDITRAISQVITPEKPTIGMMSALPVFGGTAQSDDDADGPAGRHAGWTLVQQLKQDFNVKQIEMTADKIDDDVKVLLVIHPEGAFPTRRNLRLTSSCCAAANWLPFSIRNVAMAAAAAESDDGHMGGGVVVARQIVEGLGPDSLTPAKSSPI